VIPYVEIFHIVTQNGPSLQRVAVACVFAAQDVLEAKDSTPARITWARTTLAAPVDMARKMLWAVVAAPTISGQMDKATDAAIKEAVVEHIDTFSLA
jgi:tartrate dehydratase beta subunit/fumarate hydratase class I family protein